MFGFVCSNTGCSYIAIEAMIEARGMSCPKCNSAMLKEDELKKQQERLTTDNLQLRRTLFLKAEALQAEKEKQQREMEKEQVLTQQVYLRREIEAKKSEEDKKEKALSSSKR